MAKRDSKTGKMEKSRKASYGTGSPSGKWGQSQNGYSEELHRMHFRSIPLKGNVEIYPTTHISHWLRVFVDVFNTPKLSGCACAKWAAFHSLKKILRQNRWKALEAGHRRKLTGTRNALLQYIWEKRQEDEQWELEITEA